MDDVNILQAEVAALRAEIRRLNTPPPQPTLNYYRDLHDVVARIRERGVHFDERHIVADWLERLSNDIDSLRAELREATTFPTTI